MPLKDVIKELALLLSLSIITAFTVNFVSPKGIALFGEWDTSRGVITAKSKDDIVTHQIEIDDVQIAKQIYDSGISLFVDARSRDRYSAGHIKGAVSMPVDEINDIIDPFISTYPPDTQIITYCSGRECDDSHFLAQFLKDLGYKNIRVFIDGYPGWTEKGYPIDR
jgi:rhodanese-related sulfurtransferase